MDDGSHNKIMYMLGQIDTKLDGFKAIHEDFEKRTSTLEQQVVDLNNWKSGVLGRFSAFLVVTSAITAILVGYITHKIENLHL